MYGSAVVLQMLFMCGESEDKMCVYDFECVHACLVCAMNDFCNCFTMLFICRAVERQMSVPCNDL